MKYIQGDNELDILNYRQYESVKLSECSEKGETIGILLRRNRFAVGTYIYNSDSSK